MEIAVWSMELQSMYWQWPCESWILQTRASKWTLSRYCFVKLSHLNFEKNNQKTLIATQTIFNTTKLQNCCYMVHPTLAILFLVCVWVYRAPFNSHTDPPLFSYTSLFYWLAAAQDVICRCKGERSECTTRLPKCMRWINISPVMELTFTQEAYCTYCKYNFEVLVLYLNNSSFVTLVTTLQIAASEPK